LDEKNGNIEDQDKAESENSDRFLDTIDKIVPLIIKYIEKKLMSYDTPLAKSTIWGFMIILVACLGTTFTLVMLEKIDSASFTFIIGIILGYMLSMAKIFLRRESD